MTDFCRMHKFCRVIRVCRQQAEMLWLWATQLWKTKYGPCKTHKNNTNLFYLRRAPKAKVERIRHSKFHQKMHKKRRNKYSRSCNLQQVCLILLRTTSIFLASDKIKNLAHRRFSSSGAKSKPVHCIQFFQTNFWPTNRGFGFLGFWGFGDSL